jgi:acyl-CoA synthetase (AMP-forming)/AMP-acid ligase II
MIEQEGVNYISAWPHMAQQIAAHPSFARRDFSRVKGGNVPLAIPPHLRKRSERFNFALGMSETAGPHTAFIYEEPDGLCGTFGPSTVGMEHRIVDIESRAVLPTGAEGELEVRGDALMLGYVGKERAETFTSDGWFATGDRCRIDSGHIFFLGRVDDMIKSAGANISPREVETALREIPGVANAFVVGISDPMRGAVAAAAVVLDGQARLSEADIRDHARRSLSSYKIPRIIRVSSADEIAMTASNKIDRRRLIQLLEQHAAPARS